MVHIQKYVEVKLTRTVPRFFTCEKCGCGFTFEVTATGTGSAPKSVFIDAEDDAWQAASIQAMAKVRSAAAACPDCGWYQSSTIPLLRRAHHGWVRVTGHALVDVSVLAAATWALLLLNDARLPERTAAVPAYVAVGLVAAAGGALTYWHRQKGSKFDPNSAWPQRVVHRGAEHRARRTEEFQAQVDLARAAVATAPSAEWYFVTAAGQHGPVTAAALRGYVQRQQVGPTDRVWTEGMEAWLAASAVFGPD